MSDYERWTIYPLLLLILGIVLKDKMLKSVDVQNVVCRNLAVVDSQGKEMVRLGTTRLNAGEVQIFSASGAPIITLAHDGEGKRGVIATSTDGGQTLVDVRAQGDVGLISMHGPQGLTYTIGPGIQAIRVPNPPADAKPQPPAGANQGEPAAEQPKEKTAPERQASEAKEKSAAQP